MIQLYFELFIQVFCMTDYMTEKEDEVHHISLEDKFKLDHSNVHNYILLQVTLFDVLLSIKLTNNESYISRKRKLIFERKTIFIYLEENRFLYTLDYLNYSVGCNVLQAGVKYQTIYAIMNYCRILARSSTMTCQFFDVMTD